MSLLPTINAAALTDYYMDIYIGDTQLSTHTAGGPSRSVTLLDSDSTS